MTTPPDRLSRAARVLTAAGGAAGAVAVTLLFGAMLARWSFPLELEWMEDGALQHARWIAAGRPLYPPPSEAFVPYLYTPLYPLVLAALSFVLPLDFGLGRAVSIVAAAAAMAGVARIVLDEGRSRRDGWLAAGLFASSYVFTYRFLDLVRADSLMLALSTWGLWCLRRAPSSRRAAAAAGLLLALAFWTKQTAVLLLFGGGLAALWVGRRNLWVVVVSAGTVGLGGLWAGQAATDGWMWTYIYELHQSHAFNADRFRAKAWLMLAHAGPFAVVAAIAAGVALRRLFTGPTRRLDDDARARRAALWRGHAGIVFWGVVAASALLAGALGYATQWAEANAFLPSALFGSIALVVALPSSGWACLVARGACVAQVLFGLLVEPQVQPLWDEGPGALGESYRWQAVHRTIPTAAAAGRAADQRRALFESPRPVFALHRPWWNVLSGGDGHAGAMGLHDVRPDDRRRIERALGAAVRAGRYGPVYTEGAPPAWLRSALRGGYRMTERRTGDRRVLPMTGWLSEAGMTVPNRRPQFRFDPIEARIPPPGTRVIADFEGGGLAPMRRVGGAFPPRAQRLFEGRLPAVGPHGGEFYLCSTPSSYVPKARGRLVSPPVTLGPGAFVVVHAAATGPADRLALVLVDPGGRVAAQAVPDGPPFVFTRFELRPTKPGTYTVEVRDDAARAAVCVDDLWVLHATAQ